MRVLMIDDRRTMRDAVMARSYWEGIERLKNERWDVLYLDNDLGDFDENGREHTGYDVLCWLEDNRNCLPKKIVLITSNPVARQRMELVLRKLYCRNHMRNNKAKGIKGHKPDFIVEEKFSACKMPK